MTDMTPERIAELRAVAERATPGEWSEKRVRAWDETYSEVEPLYAVTETTDSAPAHACAYPPEPQDATHIATFDPTTVLALIAALEAKTAEVEGYKQHFPCDGGCSYGDGPQEDCSRHGRNPRDLWDIITQLARERDEARAEVERLKDARAIFKSSLLATEAMGGRSIESLAEALMKMSAEGLRERADRADAALERVRALHRKAHAIFSWSEGGVRYEEPCENCNGAPGVHDCGCWADLQVEYVCAECDRGKGKHRDSGWPCPTVQAIEGTAW